MARTQLVRKVYLDSNGERSRSAKADWSALVFEFLAPKGEDDDEATVLDTRTISREDVEGTLPNIWACAAGHGLSQKLGDALAGIAGKAAKANETADPERGFADFAMAIFDEALEDLQNDVWVTEGEGGGAGTGSVTILLEAIVAAFADQGKVLEGEALAKVKENLKDEDWRKKAKGRADIAAHVARITAERAAARAAKAAEKADSATVDALDDLL